ncbi:MAG: flagellar basal body-associated FliL family protein [Aeromonadaceae bacterium]
MKLVRVVVVALGALVLVAGSVAASWMAFQHKESLLSLFGSAPPQKELSQKPLFKPLEKMVISLQSEESSHYLLLEMALVTHDPEQLAQLDELKPVIRNALVQYFSHRNLQQVRKDLQQLEVLQADLLAKLSGTISNYGYKPALDDVLITKVVVQ